ncbi:MAG: serine protease [Polyangiaceae bacterium]
MRIARWLTLVTLGLIAGCGSENDGELHVRERRQGIIGGAYDTAHPAVIHYVIMNGATQVGACSGTMVSNVNGHAIVLTAAHCFKAGTQYIVQIGGDANAPSATYRATSWELFPTNQLGQTDVWRDLAVIFVDNVPANLPVIPIGSTSIYPSYTPATKLVLVGFGVQSPTSLDSTKRKWLETSFDQFVFETMNTKTPAGTVCHGDSGGAIIDPAGGDHLVGVIRGHRVDPCVAGGGEGGTAFFAPEITAWLRAKGVPAPDATEPNGARCASDAMCASGACMEVQTPNLVPPTTFMCQPPLANGYVCKSSSHCASHLCAAGACAACTSNASCAAGETCSAGTCVMAPPASVDGGTSLADGSTTSVTDGGAAVGSPDGGGSGSGGERGAGSADPGPAQGAATSAPENADDAGGCTTSGRRGDASALFTLLVACSAWSRRRRASRADTRF